MKKTLLILSIIGVLSAGPGDYLGFDLLKYWSYEAISIDSSINGVTVDTTSDTTIITDTFSFQGYPAYEVLRTHDGEEVGRDTLWEVGDSLFGKTSLELDSTIDVLLYITPFNVGDSWSMGLPSYFVSDFDDPPDGIMDTAFITYDLTKVIDIEAVGTPYGSFDSTYKIERVFHYDIWISSSGQGGPYTGSGYDTVYEWISPNFGLVKDTSRSETTIWVIIFPVKTTKMTRRLLTGTGYITDVEETKDASPPVRIILRRGEFTMVNLPASVVYIYDLLGRRVKRFNYSAGNSVKLDLPNGIYILFIENGNGYLKRKILFLR